MEIKRSFELLRGAGRSIVQGYLRMLGCVVRGMLVGAGVIAAMVALWDATGDVFSGAMMGALLGTMVGITVGPTVGMLVRVLWGMPDRLWVGALAFASLGGIEGALVFALLDFPPDTVPLGTVLGMLTGVLEWVRVVMRQRRTARLPQ